LREERCTKFGIEHVSQYTVIYNQSKFFKTLFRQQVLASHKPLSGLLFEEISVKTLTTNRFVFVVKSVYRKLLKEKA